MTKEDRINELRAQFLEYEKEWNELKKEKKECKAIINGIKIKISDKQHELKGQENLKKNVTLYPIILNELKKTCLMGSLTVFCVTNIIAALVSIIFGSTFYISTLSKITVHLFCCIISALFGIGLYSEESQRIKKDFWYNKEEVLDSLIQESEQCLAEFKNRELHYENKKKEIKEKEEILVGKILELNEELSELLGINSQLDFSLIENDKLFEEMVISRIRKQLV